MDACIYEDRGGCNSYPIAPYGLPVMDSNRKYTCSCSSSHTFIVNGPDPHDIALIHSQEAVGEAHHCVHRRRVPAICAYLPVRTTSLGYKYVKHAWGTN